MQTIEKRAGSPSWAPCPLVRHEMFLEPLRAFRRADVDGLLDLDPHHLLARLVERQHRVVVHLELAPVNLGLKHLRPRNHVVPEDDLLAVLQLWRTASSSRLGTMYRSMALSTPGKNICRM